MLFTQYSRVYINEWKFKSEKGLEYELSRFLIKVQVRSNMYNGGILITCPTIIQTTFSSTDSKLMAIYIIWA